MIKEKQLMSRFDKNIFNEIDKEREYQDKKWGGHSNDDKLDMAQWAGFVSEYATGSSARTWQKPSRERFVKAAALCVAAIEALDRKVGR